MNKLIIGLIVLFVIVGGVFLFTRQGSAPAAPTDQLPADTTTQTGTNPDTGTTIDVGTDVGVGTVKEFTVTGSNFSFDPKEIRVKKGDLVSVTFKNMNGTHDWRLEGYNVGTKQIQGGQEETVSFAANNAGTFEYYCSVGQHRAMGMVGKFIVE